MLVDPELLRAVASQADTVASMISDAQAATKVATAGDGLPGSSTQWAARLVSAHVAAQADAISANVAELGDAVRGSGNAYEVTDTDLAEDLQGVF